MDRKLALAAAAILLFGGGSMAVVYWVTREPPGTSSYRGPGTPEPPPTMDAVDAPVAPPVARAPVDMSFTPPTAPGAVPQMRGPESGPPPPKPPAGSWEAVKPAARPGALGPLGAAVASQLNELQETISTCFSEDEQARHGQERVATVQDQPSEDYGTTVLMLHIEATAEEARIVDAPVQTKGGSSDGLIACVQRKVRGVTVPVAGGKPGRYRLLYTVQQ